MKRFLSVFISTLCSIEIAFADYSSHGRPWDADDNYDSSHGLWVVLGIIALGVIIFIGAVAKNVWDNHKDSIKEGFGTLVFFGVCILLFLGGKTCSESNKNASDNNVSTHQYVSPSPQTNTQIYQPTLPNNNNSYNNQRMQQPQFRTEYYDEKCYRCSGTGQIVCPYCSGKGYEKVSCSNCNGRGYKQVYKVVRSTLDPATWEETDKVYGYEDEYCTYCFGTGYKKSRCSHCNSEYPYGNSLISTYITCPECRGQGVFHKSRQVPYMI
ncbi:MAG: hypothetical protein ACI305_04610 [Lepagella sp.]